MKDWLRKRLDAYEGRAEKRDADFADLLIRNVDALSHRPTLRRYIAVLAVANLLIWLSVIIFPKDVAGAWNKVTDICKFQKKPNTGT